MKKEKLIEYNKTYILKAAKKLFLENGVNKTTVDEIAKEADCSKATIYVYFKNKDDIYYHIVCEYMAALRDGVRRCFENNNDFEKAYFSVCGILTEFQKEYPMYFECILGKISIDPQKSAELPVLKQIYDVGEEINDIVCGFIIRAKTEGFVRADTEPLQATFVMWSSICRLIDLYAKKKAYLESKSEIDSKNFLNNGFEMILKMIKAGGQ